MFDFSLLLSHEQMDFLLENIPNLLLGFPGHRPGGLLMSIFLAAAAVSLGFMIAVALGTGFESRRRAVRSFSQGYVQLFRGIPLILLLLDDAIDFSVTYFWDNQSFLIRKDSYGSIDELIGETVAANAGSSVVPSWQTYSAEMGGPAPDIVEFDDKLAAMQVLRDGAVEGYSEDNITLFSLAAGDPALELLPGGHNPVRFGIGLPNDDSVWRDQINYTLQELWKDGIYQEIYDRWFVGPEKIIDLPLGSEMEILP